MELFQASEKSYPILLERRRKKYESEHLFLYAPTPRSNGIKGRIFVGESRALFKSCHVEHREVVSE